MNIDFTFYFSIVLSSGFVSTIVWKLFENSITAKIINRIKHQYDKRLEDYKLENLNKQKAVLVAELFAEWASNPIDRKRLNQLSYEAFIWLPKEITQKLSLRLTNAYNAPDSKEILADIRVLMLGDSEKIDAGSIIHF